MRQGLAIFALCVSALLPSVAQESPMVLLHGPALTPDGKAFAFEWDDDLWLASTKSGEAKRIIDAPGRDMFPRITPDGTRIVFTSDRSGSRQVYSTPLTGGPTTQHTFHTEGNQLECLSPCGTRAIVRGLRDRSGYHPWRLMEISLNTPQREIRLFEARAQAISWSSDTSPILFCRGGELSYRQGFRGSRASRIWSFEKSTRSFHLEIPGDFEARSPLWLPDVSGFYFVSNESGTANLWLKKNGESPRQLTFYQNEGILTPDLSHDGSTLIFRHGFDLVQMDINKPDQLRTFHAFTREPLADRSTETIPITGCLHADISHDLTQIVFSEAGELWWIPKAGDKPTRLTNTPAAEESPRFSPNGQWLYFLSDDGLSPGICRARLLDGKLSDITTLSTSPTSKSNLTPSPCGKHIAWIEARGDLRVADADGTNPRTVFPTWNKPTFSWSPDGRWIAVAAEDRNANNDVILVSTQTERPPINLTRHPDFDGYPHWSPDGRRIVFTSKRGKSGKAQLWCIDFGKSGIGENPTADWLHKKSDAAQPLSTRGIEPRRVLWSNDPHILYFQSRTTSNTRLYQLDVDQRTMISLSETNGIPIRVTPDGSLLWRALRVPQLFHHGEVKPFPIDSSLIRARSDFLRLGFRRIWRLLGERFHDPTMNGHDWKAIREKFEPIAATSRTSREFDHIISRLLGTLNASHLVFQRKPWRDELVPKNPNAQTLHTGIRFAEPSGSALTVSGIIPGSPASQLADPPLPGETILRIAGQTVHDSTPLDPLFHGSPGMNIPMAVRNANGRERTLSLSTISYAEARMLDSRANQNLAATRAAAHSGIAYIHLTNMEPDSLHDLQLFVHRSSESHKALILDLRDNGGGREANRMLALFHQNIPFTTRPRGGPDGYPYDRLLTTPWPHPVAVICNENTYSNSEIFCHAFRTSQRGPLVGTPTAGGVISAVMSDIPGLGKLQIPFRTWIDPKTQSSLDLNGALPTHPIPLTPADEDAGLDPQLLKALSLLTDHDGTKP